MPKILEGAKTPLELLNRYNFCRGVVGTCDANDTMSRWSDQLLLTAENDHIEGSMLLKAKGGTKFSIVSRFCQGGGNFFTKKSR